jgi:hypothetical protein
MRSGPPEAATQGCKEPRPKGQPPKRQAHALAAPLLRVRYSRPGRFDISFEGPYRVAAQMCDGIGSRPINGGNPIRGRGSQHGRRRGCHVPRAGSRSRNEHILSQDLPTALCELLEGAALLVEERAELGAASIAGPQACAGPWEVGASGLFGRQLPSRCDLRQP